MSEPDWTSRIRPELRGAALRVQSALRDKALGDIDTLALYEYTVAEAQRVIEAVYPDQMHLATPCTEWDVRAVINHMVALNWAAVAYANDEPLPDCSADLVGDAPARAFAASASAAGEALRCERPFHMPFGKAPGTLVAALRAVDLLVHTWDVAKAMGQSTALDPALCETALAISHVLMGDFPRGPGLPMAPEVPVPDDAPVCDRLIGFHGRQP